MGENGDGGWKQLNGHWLLPPATLCLRPPVCLVYTASESALKQVHCLPWHWCQVLTWNQTKTPEYYLDVKKTAVNWV